MTMVLVVTLLVVSTAAATIGVLGASEIVASRHGIERFAVKSRTLVKLTTASSRHASNVLQLDFRRLRLMVRNESLTSSETAPTARTVTAAVAASGNATRRILLLNQCWSQPCQNGATCYGSAHSYYCFCTRSFVGENCELGVRYSTIAKCTSSQDNDSLKRVNHCNKRGTCLTATNSSHQAQESIAFCHSCLSTYFGARCERIYSRKSIEQMGVFVKLALFNPSSEYVRPA